VSFNARSKIVRVIVPRPVCYQFLNRMDVGKESNEQSMSLWAASMSYRCMLRPWRCWLAIKPAPLVIANTTPPSSEPTS